MTFLSQSLLKKHLKNFSIALFAIVMALYGLMAIDAGQGLVVEGSVTERDALVIERDQLRKAASAGVDVDGAEQPYWTQITAKLTSDRHIFGTDSYFDHHVYLAEMPSLDALVLGVHAILAGVCMVFGALQFIPAMRRRYPIWHRRLGKVFVLFGLISMALSVVYLLRTPPEDTYGGLTFHAGLWILAFGVTGSLILAVYHVSRREIARHQVYMSLAYGLMLTAPLLRYDWMSMGVVLHEQLSFNEINYAVNVLLIPQSFLIGYFLILLGRSKRPSSQVAQTRPAAANFTLHLNRWSVLGAAYAAACIGTLLANQFGLSLGIAIDIIPESVWINHERVLGGSTSAGYVFLTASCLAFALFPILLATIFTGQAPKQQTLKCGPANHLAPIFAFAVLVSGAVQLIWGWQLGLPSHATASAGAGLLISGSACSLFGLSMVWAYVSDDLAYFKEWAIFGILFLASPAVFLWALSFLSMVGLPQSYIDDSHAYTLASAVGPALVMAAFIYIAYGQANQGAAPLRPKTRIDRSLR